MPRAEAFRFWWRLGWIGFGGPAGQIALMHTELVQRRRWISEARFLHALNYCTLLPGPEAQQLATYLGWLMHRSWGGVVAGVLFVLPSFFILVALAWAYMALGQVPWVAGAFAGLQASALALVVMAARRMGRHTLHNRWTLGVAATACVAMLAGVPFPALVLVAAVAGGWAAWRGQTLFARPLATAPRPSDGADADSAPPADAAFAIGDHTPPPAHAHFRRSRLVGLCGLFLGLWAAAMGALWLGPWANTSLAEMGLFFTQAALVTFGGAYAVLPYVAQAAVEHHQWLSAQQMMAALALGETTPGPLVMVLAFVGFVAGWGQQVMGADNLWLGGLAGALVATFFTFLPSFFFILAGGPLVEASRGWRRLAEPLAAMGSAAIGAIAALAVFLTQHTLWPQGWGGSFNAASALLALLAVGFLWRGRVGLPLVLLACALVGALWLRPV